MLVGSDERPHLLAFLLQQSGHAAHAGRFGLLDARGHETQRDIDAVRSEERVVGKVTGVQTCALPIYVPTCWPFSCSRVATRHTPGALDCLTRAATRLSEILTLFRILPTLCRTLVAISAIPAWRDAVISCLWTRSSSRSDSLRSVVSWITATAPRIWPSGPINRRALDRVVRGVAARGTITSSRLLMVSPRRARARGWSASLTGVTPSARYTSAARR